MVAGSEGRGGWGKKPLRSDGFYCGGMEMFWLWIEVVVLHNIVNVINATNCSL